MSQLPLPILNLSDEDHYLLVKATNHIIKKRVSSKDLKIYIQDSKLNSVEKKISCSQKIDAAQNFPLSKVGDIAVCDTCGVKRCEYLTEAIG